MDSTNKVVESSNVVEGTVDLSFGKSIGMKIQPVAKGAKKQGLGKLILGVALVGLSFGLGGAAGAALFTNQAGATILSSTTLGQFGAVMVLQGLSSLLTKAPSTTDSENDGSFLLTTNGNTIKEGSVVPTLFGEVFTNSVVISTGLDAEDIPNLAEDTEATPEEPQITETVYDHSEDV